MSNRQVKTKFVFTALSMIFIGILNILAEASKQIKNFLTLNNDLGPYSGKILYGILISLIISFIYYYSSKESKFDIKRWTMFLLIALIIACLFVFTPFIHLILSE